MLKNTILWVDDDPDDLQLMKDVLVKHNQSYIVEEVSNGKEALDYLDNASSTGSLPCLIILDINMPVLDGKKTLSIIKRTEQLKDIPVVVFTTSESEIDRSFCRRYGTEMITKPPTYQSLELTVIKILKACS